LQGQIIKQIDVDVDKANATLDNLNSRMKKALESVSVVYISNPLTATFAGPKRRQIYLRYYSSNYCCLDSPLHLRTVQIICIRIF
jgi:hypothetical protein